MQENLILEQKILKKNMVYQKKSKQILENTLKFSGMSIPEEIDYRSVRIYQIDHIHEIYTNNQSTILPHLVLLHGFGGTSMTYIRFFKSLKNYYKLHALDALGVGHSSKGIFKTNFTYEQARHYYIDALEQWRVAMGIQNFILVGHSFGGYLASCYTESYPERVSRLILLSPVGTTEKTAQQIKQQLQNRYKDEGIKAKFFNYFGERVYNMKIRPSKAMGSFIIGQKLIDRIVDFRLKLKHEQGQAWKSYFKDLSAKQSASQIGFYLIFEWPLKPKHTIQSILTRMNTKIQIQFYFGEHDWMDSKGAQRLSNKNDNIKYNKISNADHQLIFDNPDQICYYIMMRRTPGQLALHSKYQSIMANKQVNHQQNAKKQEDSPNQSLQKQKIMDKLVNLNQNHIQIGERQQPKSILSQSLEKNVHKKQ